MRDQERPAAPPALVIFDCDGVLVDSEPIAAQVDAELLAELGWAISVEEVQDRFIGSSAQYFRSEVEAALGRPMPRDWDDRFRERFEVLAARHLTAVSGVAGVLAALVSAQVPCCVASNSRRERVAWCLRRTGLAEYFGDRIFTARDVAHPKPAPDLFLHAAASLGAPPEDSVVVEDSRFGVEAARRSGMAVFGYAGGLTARASLEGPGTTVFEDMADLPALLGLGAAPAAGVPLAGR